MNQYIVSARKYRPITFDSVVGQRHIAETLINAIKSEHLAQAFLFSGPRGVGKTTCARILAKTINCTNRSEKIEACDKCPSCESFNAGHSLNIYELDAASNNSVEDIRGLIEQVRFAPQLGTKKVYIIDEVHMLSTQAFNAFLKTLEEPPSHAIFILATTEKHKIIPTILSRCQVFDFNRIEVDQMKRHLESIANKEGVSTESDALHLIAQKSDGSLRDALSMFDQMVTYSGQNLTYKAVVENLSILSADYFFELTDFLVSSETAPALLLFNEVLQKGFDGHNFLLSFAEHLRNLLVCQDHSTIELLTAGDQIKEKYREQTMRVSSDFLIKSLNLISNADVRYKSAKNQRLLVELTLINIANLKAAPQEERPQDTGFSGSSLSKKKPIDVVKKEEKTGTSKATESLEVKEERIPETEIPAKPALDKQRESTPVAAVASGTQTEVADATETLVEEEEVDRSQKGDSEGVSKNEKTETHEKIIENRNLDRVKPKEDEVVTTENTAKSDFENISDTISINAFMEPGSVKPKSKTQAVSGGPVQKEEINQEQLDRAWNSMVGIYQEKGRMSFYTTLTKYKPVLTDGPTVEITYDNKAQLQSINSEKGAILDYLRSTLRNDLISLSTVISDEEYQKPYTPAEKLEKLIEKNPNINLLKNKLDLDLGQ